MAISYHLDLQLNDMPDSLTINGGKPLTGEVKVSGAKNSVTKLMVASLLTDEEVTIRNTPKIGDVEITSDLCRQVGSQIKRSSQTLKIHTPLITNDVVTQKNDRNRIPILALAPLMHRTRSVELPKVGGDKIGYRPVNFHLSALQKMGASIKESESSYIAHAKRLSGATIRLPYPSVGATENIILAASLVKGRTIISNAAIEPEISDLIMMLQRMGAIIEFEAGRRIIIDGVKKLRGTAFTVMPDRLEAASYAVLALATGGSIFVRNAVQAHLVTFLNTLRRMGADYQISDEGILFKAKNTQLNAITVKTDVWPGFATDWQQPLSVLMTQARGQSVIHETVYESRFDYIEGLKKMGASIKIVDFRKTKPSENFKGTHYSQSAVIKGASKLHGATVQVPDIRAGMAHVIAALTAKGQSQVLGVSHLIRGYDDVIKKLHSLKADFYVS